MTSKLEETFAFQLKAAKLTDGMVREYRFAAEASGGTGEGVRKRLADAGLKDWRVDFAWPEKKLAVEIEGGIWTGGRHTRGAGFDEDIFKYNCLTLMGWRLLRFTGTSIKSGVALESAEVALQQKWTTIWQILA